MSSVHTCILMLNFYALVNLWCTVGWSISCPVMVQSGLNIFFKVPVLVLASLSLKSHTRDGEQVNSVVCNGLASFLWWQGFYKWFQCQVLHWWGLSVHVGPFVSGHLCIWVDINKCKEWCCDGGNLCILGQECFVVEIFYSRPRLWKLITRRIFNFH